MQAISNVQPKDVMELLEQGANPFEQVFDEKNEPQSALMFLLNNPTWMGLNGHNSSLGAHVAKATERLLQCLPKTTQECQEVANCQMQALGKDATSKAVVDTLYQQTLAMNGSLSPTAWQFLKEQARQTHQFEMQIVDSPAWKMTSERMNPLDLQTYQESCVKFIEHGKTEAKSVIATYQLYDQQDGTFDVVQLQNLSADRPFSDRQDQPQFPQMSFDHKIQPWFLNAMQSSQPLLDEGAALDQPQPLSAAGVLRHRQLQQSEPHVSIERKHSF